MANSQGYTQILHLLPGRYTSPVTASRFTTWQQKDIEIEGTDVRTISPPF